mgnify:CR=1 FL=1
MNAMIKSLLITMGTDVLTDVLKDMTTPEGVMDWRDDVIAFGNKLTGKTVNPYDDYVWTIVAKHILTPENWALGGSSILTMARSYVAHNDTKYDDFLIPIFDGFITILTPAEV